MINDMITKVVSVLLNYSSVLRKQIIYFLKVQKNEEQNTYLTL